MLDVYRSLRTTLAFPLAATLAIAAVLGLAACVAPGRPTATTRYALLIDASSSGSRVHVFQFRQSLGEELPWVRAAPYPRAAGEAAWQTVVDGGLSDYAADPSAAGESLAPLMQFALDKLDNLGVAPGQVPLLLKATAGMRLLADPQRSAIMNDVSDYLAATPFDFRGAEIISGDQEGVYGWITVNYILGLLGNGGPFPTVGALDLGGASTQITFLPIDFPEQDTQQVELGGATYHVYTHSYLGLGQDEARAAVASTACYPRGYAIPGGADGFAESAVGAGDFEACRQAIRVTFSRPCEGSDCSMMGVYQPPLYGDFFGFSVFGYAASFFGLGQNLSLEELASRGNAFCGRDWQQTLALYPDQADSKYLPRYCYSAAHIVTLLADGYGFPMNTSRITTPSRVQGSEVSWVLGSLVAELADRGGR
jgi:apyrase